MTPLKLVFAAFGPFRRRQELDFSELGGSRMFLITGKTGSGKTTLFDAICYALYGEASGALRRADQLKSDFAGTEERCFVEYTFEAGGRVYTVSRAPTQQLARQRGEGERTVQTTASLRYDTGGEISGVTAVNHAILEILGINAEQFRKIVLLPQGEFRSFLDADSRKRQEIFRSIFDTQIFAAFTDCLKAEEAALREQYEHSFHLLAALVRSVPLRSEELDRLLGCEPLPVASIAAEIDRLIAQRTGQAAQIKKQSEELVRQRAAIHLEEAQMVNRKLTEYSESQANLRSLTAGLPEMEREKARIDRLAGVRLLKLREDAVVSVETRLTAAQLDLDRIKAEYARLLPEKKKAEEALREAQAAQNRLPALQEEKNRLGRIQDKWKELEKQEVAQKTASGKRQQCIRRMEILKLLQERCHAAERAKGSSAAADSLTELRRMLLQASQARETHLAAKEAYLTGYSRFLDGQAGILAQTLQDGTPCPVCGAVHHPNPAALAQGTPAQAEVDHLRQRADKAAEQLSAAGAAAAESWQRASLRLEAENLPLPALELLTESPDKLDEAAAPVFEAVRQAEQERLRAEEILLQQQVGQKIWNDPKFQNSDFLEQKIGELRQEYAEYHGAMQAAIQAAARLAEEIPPEYREKETLPGRLSAIDREISAISAALDEANHLLRRMAGEESRLAATQTALSEQVKQADAERREKQEEFDLYFQKAGYCGMEHYRADLRELPSLERRQKAYEEFQKRLTRARAVSDRLAAETEGLHPFPLEEMTVQAETLDREIQDATRRAAALEADLQSAGRTAKQIAQERKQLEMLTSRYQTAAALSKAAGGNNPAALSFERYVLSGFFDQIVESANLRLQTMSSGRYFLSRKGEKGRGRRPSGLDLEVLDVNTGKYRDTNTLSGGESFLTALSLALAVAEVITEYSGGVEINTMLIDEGFGSLDADSLEVVMDALQQLQGGSRLVGIISHVETLAHYIPAKLAVTATRQGSFAQFHC